MSDGFKSLEELIEKYYELVQEYPSGLPPYATFKTYLVDDKEDCINRPKKIKDLVNQLNSENDRETRLNAILQLWASNKKSTVLHEKFRQDDPQLIHSITPRANTIATQLKLKEVEGFEEQKERIIEFGGEIYKLVQEYKNLDFNKLGSAEKELIFWAYYDNDVYPIINTRARNSKEILKRVFQNKNDIENDDMIFNGTCIGYFKGEEIKIDDQQITKQLMLDQLFFSIDEMKSMKKVDEFYKNDKSNDIYKFYQKLWHTIKDAKRVLLKDELDTFKNVIYHGAPGTGKTYELKKEIKEYLDYFDGGHSEFIQFHSSYYYEDFIGGLKPNTKSENGLSLEFRNGVFKELCRKAAQYEIAYYTSDDYNDETKKQVVFEVEGKGFKLSKENPDFSQFPPFFILIDEINRADLSKVFGELLFAIEDDYRGFEHAFKLSTSQMENEETAVLWDEDKKEAKFFVPVNLYIRGTMNDIDRSVDSIDFAFRRRFKWVEKNYDENILQEMLFDSYEQSSINNYVNLANKLNKKIVAMHIDDKSYEIGHAIFRNIVKYTKDNKISERSREKLFDNHIEPIVYNYLKMDYGNESKDLKNFRDDFVKKANEKN